jgi:hypothetical protein
VSRGIADLPEDVEDVEGGSAPVSLDELAEMLFIVFNEVKAVSLKLDELEKRFG